jgi:hypothetical protein
LAFSKKTGLVLSYLIPTVNSFIAEKIDDGQDGVILRAYGG